MLKMKLSGATEKTLVTHARSHYGVTKGTAEEYVNTVMIKWKMIKK